MGMYFPDGWTWHIVIVNFITKLLLVAEKNVILVVCNRLSKIIYFVTTTEVSRSQKVDLAFSYFLILIFFSIYFYFYIFRT